ncbi:MAG: hypothetical protein ACXVJ0_16415, partial [Candidatus Angelobacter sp.]
LRRVIMSNRQHGGGEGTVFKIRPLRRRSGRRLGSRNVWIGWARVLLVLPPDAAVRFATPLTP